jgi:hypothetical protein
MTAVDAFVLCLVVCVLLVLASCVQQNPRPAGVARRVEVLVERGRAASDGGEAYLWGWVLS